MLANWYIARARLGRARWLSRSLRENMGIDTLCPVERIDNSTLIRPVFGSHFFFEAPIVEAPVMWHSIARWPYLAEILGGNQPWGVADADIQFWRSNTDDDGLIINQDILVILRRHLVAPKGKTPGEVGQRVWILQAAEPNSEVMSLDPVRVPGKIDWISDDKIMCRVKIEGLLGRDPIVTIPLGWCEIDRGTGPPRKSDPHRNGGRRGMRGRHRAKLAKSLNARS